MRRAGQLPAEHLPLLRQCFVEIDSTMNAEKSYFWTFPYFFAIKLLPFKLLIIIQRYAQSEYQVFQSAVLLVYFYHYENNSDVLAEPVKFQSFVRKIKANSRPGHVIMNEK